MPTQLMKLSLIIIVILISNVAAAISMDLKAICNSTSYPTLCYDGLMTIFEPAAGHLGLHEVYTSSLRIAIDELLAASNELLKLEALIDNDDDRRQSLFSAIQFCRELLSVRAFTSLKDSLAVVGLNNGSPTATTFVDLKIRLTAAGIYHQTCLDVIGDASDDGRSKIRRADIEKIIKNSTQLTSNSLAILHAFEESIGATNSHSSGDMQLTNRSEVQEKFYTPRLLRFVADVVVAKDGSGNFTRIGDALRVVPSESNRTVVIYVKAGVYDEIVNVGMDKWNVVMIGDGMEATIVTGNLNSRDGTPSYFSATFTVSGTGFMARNMGFENTAGADKGQAVALMVEADRAIFYRCKIAAYQDTLLAQAYRQLFYRCHIYGTVDLIFGYSIAVFHTSRILLRKPMIGQENVVTAQGKYEARVISGFSFIGCNIGPAEDLTGVSTFLGRPWKDYSTVVFMYSRIGRLVDPKGWESFAGAPPPDTIYYGEHGNTGGGSMTADRVRWKGVHTRMRRSEANMFGVNAFIQGCDWINGIGIPCTRL